MACYIIVEIWFSLAMTEPGFGNEKKTEGRTLQKAFLCKSLQQRLLLVIGL